ncbi:unnamed protein product [Bursaphelenchus xylophilus]|uniref:DNA-directed DNA polymerase n=1 Tax=Bursaphelenchus xylophilus TaxID=6326 RepID=A0A811JWT1_BURXY|nr:unnamed protein product [Bursaphelenchus xylophilus]CAG9079656.1 unnamed protein product [Bursaphelenchus xylophilus]
MYELQVEEEMEIYSPTPEDFDDAETRLNPTLRELQECLEEWDFLSQPEIPVRASRSQERQGARVRRRVITPEGHRDHDPEQASPSLEGRAQQGQGIFRRLQSSLHSSNYFPESRYQGVVTVEANADAADYEEELVRLLQSVVDDTIEKTLEARPNRRITHVNLGIESEALESGIYSGFVPENDFDVRRIFTRFEKVQQSSKTANLFEKPITIKCTVCSTISGGADRQGVGGFANGLYHLVNTKGECLPLSIICGLLYKLPNMPRPARMMQRIADQNKASDTYKNYYQAMMEATKIKNPERDAFQLVIMRIEAYLNNQYRDLAPFQVVVHATENFHDLPLYPSVSRRVGIQAKTIIPIFFDEEREHFDPIIKPTKFFGARNVCYKCLSTYSHQQEHRASCVDKCCFCGRVGQGPCVHVGRAKYCDQCNGFFPNNDCYVVHQRRMCRQYATCQKCKKRYAQRHEEHQCGYVYCFKCYSYHKEDGDCFIKPLEPPEEEPVYKVVAFDFETRQEDEIGDGVFDHCVNFAALMTMCNERMNSGEWMKSDGSCRACPNSIQWYSTPEDSTVDPVMEMWKYLKEITAKGETTLAVAHNGGRFDFTLLLRAIFKDNSHRRPSIIANGEKMYKITVNGGRKFGKIILVDSLNHLPMKLAKLPQVYPLPEELGVEGKGDFPHCWNKECNYEYEGPLPPKSAYQYDDMEDAKKQKFDQWYQENSGKLFNFKEELKKYCIIDVKVLANAIASHRRECRIIRGHPTDDVWYYSCTLAGSVMRDFRMSDLPENTLIIQNESAFGSKINQSRTGLKFLRWIRKKYFSNLQFRDCPNGEKTVRVWDPEKRKQRRFSVDGYVEGIDGGKNLIIEYNGCVWHGCEKCVPNADTVLPNGKTRQDTRKQNEKRVQLLRNAGYDVVEYWECEIKAELLENEEMQEFFEDEIQNAAPAHPREAFAGGRTAALSLWADSNDRYEIGYYDSNSLYPSTLVNKAMPTGRVKVIPLNRAVDWRSAAQMFADCGQMHGIYKVFVIPPRKCYYPVIPTRIQKTLIYPLCYKCANKFAGRSFVGKHEARCEHSDEERGFITTVTSLELAVALDDAGYRVTHIMEKIEFEKMDSELFRAPVLRYYKKKMEASGPEGRNDEQIEEFIAEAQRRYGFLMRKEDLALNAAMRFNSKIILNSFWGKFSMRSRLTRIEICKSPEDYVRLMMDDSHQVLRTTIINETTMMFFLKPKEEYVQDLDFNNIFVPLWTTAAARLYLYEGMRQCEKAGAVVLYHDTGSFLGEWKNEFPDHEILEFVAGGPKQYFLKLRSKTNPEEISYKSCIRGFTMTRQAKQCLAFDRFKEMVLDNQRHHQQPIPTVQFRPSMREQKVRTVHSTKVYKACNTKGYVHDLRVYPFGYDLDGE